MKIPSCKLFLRQLSAVVLLAALVFTLIPAPEHQEAVAVIDPWYFEDASPVQQAAGDVPSMTRSRYDVGSCRQLEGSPYVLFLFLDDDVSSWSEEGVLSYLDRLCMPALEYMEDYAHHYGAQLDFRYGYYATYGHPDRPVKYNGVIDTFNEGTTSKDILDQAARALGFDSKEHMHERLMDYSGQDQIAYVVMLNKGGRSYSHCYARGASRAADSGAKDYMLEYSVIYTGFTDTSYDSASDTVCHEMLHLFGAEDYYYPESRENLARQVYPKDIMLCAMSDLQYFELGEFTAHCIGWVDEAPEICSNPGWW